MTASRPPAALALFLKYPEPGHVKTRLATALGAERAARLYRECMLMVLAKSLRLHGADVFVFYLPRDRGPAVEQLVMSRFGRFEGRFVPQAAGDLSARLHAALAHLHGLGYERQFVLGTDSPTLPLEIIQRGVDSLSDHDAVLGPSWNGAYYLIGLTQPDARIFADVAWGSGME
ncbi:MAG: TIGR04282 family arsenosugar biosynthesis glycosyltransferase, partial [bacterium]